MKHLLLFLILCASVFGANNTFNEGVDLDWNDVGNWSLGWVPKAGDTAVIPTGLAGAVDIDIATITCDEIVVQGNGTLTVSITTVITADFNNSTGSATGMTLDGTDSVVINGDVNGSDQTNGFGITLTGTPTLEITGTLTGGAGVNSHGIYSTVSASPFSTITIGGNVSGNYTGTNASQGIKLTHADDDSVVTVAGRVTGADMGATGSTTAGKAIWWIGRPTITIGTLVYKTTTVTPLQGPGYADLTITVFELDGTAFKDRGYRDRYSQ